jgi:hypothetical protein
MLMLHHRTGRPWRETARRGAALLVLLVALGLTAGCSAELPPGARGPVWESVVKNEAQYARSGQAIGVAVLVFGAALVLGGLIPGVEIFATVGLGTLPALRGSDWPGDHDPGVLDHPVDAVRDQGVGRREASPQTLAGCRHAQARTLAGPVERHRPPSGSRGCWTITAGYTLGSAVSQRRSGHPGRVLNSGLTVVVQKIVGQRHLGGPVEPGMAEGDRARGPDEPSRPVECQEPAVESSIKVYLREVEEGHSVRQGRNILVSKMMSKTYRTSTS